MEFALIDNTIEKKLDKLRFGFAGPDTQRFTIDPMTYQYVNLHNFLINSESQIRKRGKYTL